MRTKVLLFLLLLLSPACQPQKLPFDPAAHDTKLAVEKQGEAIKFFSIQEISELPLKEYFPYQDPLYGTSKRYQGPNLDQLKQLAQVDESYRVVRFHCRDGYVSEVELSELEEGEFLLAFRDLEAGPETFLPFEKMEYLQTEPEKLGQRLKTEKLSAQEREEITLKRDSLRTAARDIKALKNQGPFYPIFVPSTENAAWASPFCVEKVTFAKQKIDRSLATPEGLPPDHPAMRGSTLFQQKCSTCHSINGIGGEVAPELNRPLSVTEYWDEKALKQLMKDPAKVRGNSKMPALHLKDPMVDELLAYLQWMARNKKLP